MIDVAVADLAAVRTMAVVRPATTRLGPLGPAAVRLDVAAGAEFMASLTPRSALGIGSAIVTAAGGLSAEFLIHAVMEGRGVPVTVVSVRKALENTLRRARDWQFSSIAIPLPEADTLVTSDTARAIADALSSDVKEPGSGADIFIVVESPDSKGLVDAYLSE